MSAKRILVYRNNIIKLFVQRFVHLVREEIVYVRLSCHTAIVK